MGYLWDFIKCFGIALVVVGGLNLIFEDIHAKDPWIYWGIWIVACIKTVDCWAGRHKRDKRRAAIEEAEYQRATGKPQQQAPQQRTEPEVERANGELQVKVGSAAGTNKIGFVIGGSLLALLVLALSVVGIVFSITGDTTLTPEANKATPAVEVIREVKATPTPTPPTPTTRPMNTPTPSTPLLPIQREVSVTREYSLPTEVLPPTPTPAPRMCATEWATLRGPEGELYFEWVPKARLCEPHEPTGSVKKQDVPEEVFELFGTPHPWER